MLQPKSGTIWRSSRGCSADRNVVWEQGSWTGNINLPDHQTMDISGNFLLVAEKDGSDLPIKAHTWNVNQTP
jgi:hypothetical protein